MLGQLQIARLYFPLVANAEAALPLNYETCFVKALNAVFYYEPSGAAYTVDHVTVLSTGRGGNTRWIILNSGFYTQENYDDSMVPGSIIRSGTTAPSLGNLNIGGDTAFWNNGFQVDDELHLIVQFPHSIKINSTLRPHVHWMPDTVPVANAYMRWEMRYTWSNIGSAFVSGQTIVKEDAVQGALSQWQHAMWEFPTITANANGMTNGGISSIMLVRLKRAAITTGGKVEMTGLAQYIGFDVHFLKDSLGSLQPNSKT